MHDRLLAAASQRRAMLSTLDEDTIAAQLYRRRGWEPLLAGFYFPGVIRKAPPHNQRANIAFALGILGIRVSFFACGVEGLGHH